MPQDAFTLRLIARELDSMLAGGRINKIVQPGKDEVSLLIYTKKSTVKLVLNTNAQDCGAYFDEREEEAPLVAPNFCMLLRKRVQGAEILGVRLVGFERILCFSLRSASDFSASERKLYLEVMGKYSNLVLTENGMILGAMKTTTLDDSVRRTVFPGVLYTLPAKQDKVDPSDEAALRAVLGEMEGDPGRFLFTRVAGLAPSTAEQIAACYRGGDLTAHVRNFLFSDEISPCVVERDGKPCDFFARRVPGAIPFDTIAEAQTYYYTARKTAKAAENAKRRLTSAVRAALKKQEKRLSQTLEKRALCEDCETLRVKGELLTANLHMLSRGMSGCELPNFYDEAGGTLKIALDPQLSPSQNAQSYFKRYRKQKRTLEMLAPQEAETRAELEYLQSLLSAAEVAESREDLLSCEEELEAAELLKAPQQPRKKAKREIPFRSYAFGGFTIHAGRNNLQNDLLVRRSSPEDLWLHAQRYHSCHVVVHTDGRKVPDDVLAFAANVCAKYSDARGERIPVDCTRIKFVKKPPKSKAGFVIYTDFTTLSGDPAKAPV